ncbi:twin-arginine translocase subunit TatC [Paenibacillus sp.]|uniref:twin-arginine translocase subunit TatC n=1 Tax=Paenibacillus sp. TaxID=58172 RepID=UPI002D4699EB|nr:twin-arginine translocase subunit TatC [Paenibacillus sp.]HZG55338.1 twin-arginine translocase subunit TatC [Paenibacillus sp.]
MSEQEMHLTEHLAELRKRLIITLSVFLAALCGAFIFVEDIYAWLTRDLDGKLQVLSPSDPLWVYLMIAGVFAIAVTIPVAGFQVWRFVAPGLRPAERRTSLAYIPALAVLFLLGLAFGYLVIYPMVLQFLAGLSGPFTTSYTADKYFRFMINMTVPFGILFEMPVIVMFLTSLGVLNPLRLAKMRRVAYLVLTVTAVTITPPDPVSDILVIIPLFLLYEISVGLSRFVYRKRLAKLEAA